MSWLALSGLLLGWPGCRDLPATDATATLDSLNARIAAAKAQAEFEPALSLAEARDRVLADEQVANWRRIEARHDLATLRRLCTMPDTARTRWRALAAYAQPTTFQMESDPAEMLAALERWMFYCQEWEGTDSPDVARALSGMAMVHRTHGELMRAHDLESQSLAIRLRVLGPDHPDIASSLDCMSWDRKDARGVTPEVLSLCEHALAMRRRCLGDRSSAVAWSLLRRANYDRTRRQYVPALQGFEAAAAIFAQTEGDSSRSLAQALVDHGLTLGIMRRWADAEPLLRRGLAISRHHGGPPDALLALALNQEGVALRELGHLDAAETILREAAAVQEARWNAAPPGRSRAMRFTVAAHRDLAALALRRGDGTRAWVELERMSSRLSVDRAIARGELEATSDPWAGLLARVQRALPDSAALIGWADTRLLGEESEWPSWSFVVRKTGPPRWTRIDAPPGGGKPLRVRVARLTFALRASAEWPLQPASDHELERLARDVYGLRIAPLEPALTGVRRLIVASPDMNFGAPIESLIDDQGRLLTERFVTVYSPSALLYALARERDRAATRPRQWNGLLLGAPTGAATSAWDSLPPLSGSEREIRDLARALPHADVFVGRRAAESVLDSLHHAGALARYDFLHFATHAEHRAGWNTYAALLLAEAQRHIQSQPAEAGRAGVDGRVTVDEVDRWRLNAHLVNLAACRGLSMHTSITDGPLGLGSALLGAGARSLLVSTNAVDDAASEIFFSRLSSLLFAEGPGRVDIAAAVRDARLWLRDYQAPDGTHPYRSPAFWSGFVLVGWPD